MNSKEKKVLNLQNFSHPICNHRASFPFKGQGPRLSFEFLLQFYPLSIFCVTLLSIKNHPSGTRFDAEPQTHSLTSHVLYPQLFFRSLSLRWTTLKSVIYILCQFTPSTFSIRLTKWDFIIKNTQFFYVKTSIQPSLVILFLFFWKKSIIKKFVNCICDGVRRKEGSARMFLANEFPQNFNFLLMENLLPRRLLF